MRRIRGPPFGDTYDPLYKAQSKEELAKRFCECFDESFGQPIDLNEVDYQGCVYVLVCKNRHFKDAEKISISHHGKSNIPWWVGAAQDACSRLYVGRAKNITERLWKHAQGAGHGGAHFTDIFYPVRLQRVFLYSRYDDSKSELEGRVAQTVDNEHPNAFVYSDQYDTIQGYKTYGDDPDFKVQF